MHSHALSRTIDGRRTAPVNPNNDPHYYSYKLVGEPAPPPSQPQDDQDDDYNIQLDNGDDIEEVELSDSEDLNMNGSREEVMARLNKRIINLQNKSHRMSRDLYGDDEDFNNSSTLEHVGSADDIYKNNGGIWDAEILDHISEMREAHNQRMQTIHQNFVDSQATPPPSTKRGTSPRRASPRVTKYDSSSLYSPQFLRSSRGRNPSPRRQADSREEDEEAENQAWMYVYKETQPYQKSTRRYSFGGIGNSSMVFGKMYKPDRPVSSYSKVDYASKVTVQEPFSFNDRSNTPTRSMINVQEYIREKEDKERVTQFKARPVPASTKEPRYKDITEEQEKRKQYTHAESFALTKSLENPFSFYDRDKEKLEKKKKKLEDEKNRGKEKPPQFKANPVPDFVKQNISASEDEQSREERISSRAQDTLLQSSLPPRMSEHDVKPSVRKKYEPLKPTHSPQINKSVPNFAALQNSFAEKQERLKKEKRPTVPEEFSFHTPPKQTTSPFSSHSNPLYNFSPSLSSPSSAPSSPSLHKNLPPSTASVSSVSPSLSHSSSHSSLASPPTSSRRGPSPSPRSPNSSSPNSSRKTSSSGNSPKNGSSFPAHKTTLATELKRQMAHKKIEREESEKKKEEEEERERQRKLKAMTKEVSIRLKPFDESLPASIDERTKERKQEQIAKTKEFKQKMADMQEKMENSRLTLFERYMVESAGKSTEKRMDSSLRKLGLDDEDLKARVEKTYGRKYYDKIYGEPKEKKKKKVTVRENNSEDEDEDEYGSNRYESDSEDSSDEEQYDTKKDNNKSDEDKKSEEEKKSSESSDDEDD